MVRRALLSGDTDLERDGARVRVEAFDVERVAGPWTARDDLGRVAMQARLVSQFDLVNKNTLVYVRPGQSVVVLLIESEREDKVARAMYLELSKKTKNQFTTQRPAILCCHLADLTSAELFSLAQGGTDTGLDYLATALILRRPHLCSVTFTAPGRTGVVDEAQCIREKGLTYTVTNPNHPLDRDKRLSVFRDAWPPEGS